MKEDIYLNIIEKEQHPDEMMLLVASSIIQFGSQPNFSVGRSFTL